MPCRQKAWCSRCLQRFCEREVFRVGSVLTAKLNVDNLNYSQIATFPSVHLRRYKNSLIAHYASVFVPWIWTEILRQLRKLFHSCPLETVCIPAGDAVDQYIFGRLSGQKSWTLEKLRVRIIDSAPLAQLDRARPSGGRGQRFESSRARHINK